MSWIETLTQREPGLGQIVEAIEAVGSLPTIPAIAQRAMELARDETASMQQIAAVVSQDQALAAEVLKTVNSAYYGLRQSVGTLPLALTVLGVQEIIGILLSVAIVSAFPEPTRSRRFDREVFWYACSQRAYASKRLAHLTGLGRYASEAFLGGLVHDIGIVVLDQYLHNRFDAMLVESETLGLDLLDAEWAHFNTSHASIGAWLAEAWGFPDALIEAIAYHHDPARASWDPPITALVTLGEFVHDLHAARTEADKAVLALERNVTWTQLMSLGSPVKRAGSLGELIEKIGAEIESAPELIGHAKSAAR
ncbi:MAG: HDOD domain-containing protein [Verrucomicrobia bacterium]|nr:HDOD domain-containing protein [Verrucomicrobiota bacterium]